MNNNNSGTHADTNSKGNEKSQDVSRKELDQSPKRKNNNDIADSSITEPTNSNSNSSSSSNNSQQSISKNQLKKRRRYEKAMEVKRRRKEQEKDAKAAKAQAEGRDLDAERKLLAERTESGEGNRRRQERKTTHIFKDYALFLFFADLLICFYHLLCVQIWDRKMKEVENTFKVSIDCSFEEHMSSKEIGSLAQQIRYCYSANKRSSKPCHLSVCDLHGKTLEHLSKVSGFPDQWYNRAFSYTHENILHIMKTMPTTTPTPPTTTTMLPQQSSLDSKSTIHQNIIYLTSDSENTLEHLENDKVYVIGGIVDRNRMKGATYKRAQELKLRTGKLPLDSYLKLLSTKVLTCNHVFEILLRYRENGNDWKKAMLDVLPQRKDIATIHEHKEKDDNKGKDDKGKDNDKKGNEEEESSK